jgi:hypothetical protein
VNLSDNERMRLTEKPSQFNDPAIDTLLSLVLSLGSEVYVLRDRMRLIEKLLESKGAISRSEAIRKEADAFISRLFRTFEGNQK